MKSLFFISLLTLCCNPAELKTEVSKHTGSPDPSENWEPIGIMPTEDCMQVNIGDKVCNFRLEDQNGEVWDLYSHKGDIIVLDISAAWCYPCNVAAASAQALQDSYAKDNVQIVTVLVDGYIGATEPTSDEIQRWTSEHNIQTSPVLRGSREKMLDPSGQNGYILSAFPTYYYIDRDMRLYDAHIGFGDEYVRLKIEEKL
jgi:peroxiredoxin